MDWMTMRQAALYVGPRREGRPTDKETVREWAIRGLRGVVLRSETRGGIRMTTAEWVDDFFRRLDAPRARAPTNAERARRHERAMKRLREMGAL